MFFFLLTGILHFIELNFLDQEVGYRVKEEENKEQVGLSMANFPSIKIRF